MQTQKSNQTYTDVDSGVASKYFQNILKLQK